MKAILERLAVEEEEICRVRVIHGDTFGCTWHFHPEYELTLTLKAQGHRIVGDNISNLEAGDLVLVGSNLPHDWQVDRSVAKPLVHAIVVHFKKEIFGKGFLDKPALQPVRRLLCDSQLGLRITGRTRDKVIRQMKQIHKVHGFRRLIHLFDILDILAQSYEYKSLSSPSFAPTFNPDEEERVSRIYGYIHENLERVIRIKEIASLLNLSEGTVSRYFKSRMGKTFPEVVNELRIGRACRMLAEEELSITEIAFACGFQNLSNFNRQFSKVKNVSPRQYRWNVRHHSGEK